MRVPLRPRRVQPLLVPLERRVSGLVPFRFGCRVLAWHGEGWGLGGWSAVRYGKARLRLHGLVVGSFGVLVLLRLVVVVLRPGVPVTNVLHVNPRERWFNSRTNYVVCNGGKENRDTAKASTNIIYRWCVTSHYSSTYHHQHPDSPTPLLHCEHRHKPQPQKLTYPTLTFTDMYNRPFTIYIETPTCRASRALPLPRCTSFAEARYPSCSRSGSRKSDSSC